MQIKSQKIEEDVYREHLNGISYEKLAKINNEISENKGGIIKLVDVVILSQIAWFCGIRGMEKKMRNGEVYTWIKRSLLMKQFSFMGDSMPDDKVINRVKLKLQRAGLIDSFTLPVGDNISKTYYRVTEEYKKCLI